MKKKRFSHNQWTLSPEQRAYSTSCKRPFVRCPFCPASITITASPPEARASLQYGTDRPTVTARRSTCSVGGLGQNHSLTQIWRYEQSMAFIWTEAHAAEHEPLYNPDLAAIKKKLFFKCNFAPHKINAVLTCKILQCFLVIMCRFVLKQLTVDGSDSRGVEKTFDFSVMWPSSSMWTRVALRVTTPFPLHTLLGSKSKNKNLLAKKQSSDIHCFHAELPHRCWNHP